MKKIATGVILLVLVVPLFAFAQEATAPATSTSKFAQIEKIQEAVKQYTPEFISKPILSVVNKLESIRTGLLAKVEIRRMSTKEELAEQSNPTVGPAEVKPGDIGKEVGGILGEIIDAFKYLEIFVLFILIIALEVKLFFYGIIFILLLILSRFFWYRFY